MTLEEHQRIVQGVMAYSSPDQPGDAGRFPQWDDNQMWAMAVALFVNHQIRAGLTYCPHQGHRMCACRCKGCVGFAGGEEKIREAWDDLEKLFSGIPDGEGGDHDENEA